MGRVLIAFEPPDGGVPEQVCELALCLPSLGWDVEVAGPEEASVYPRLAAASVHIHRIRPLRRRFGRPWNEALALIALIRLLRSGRFDLVPPVERLLARRTAALILVCDAELELAASRRIGSPNRRRRVYNGCEPCPAVDVAPELGDLRLYRIVGTIAVSRREKGVDVVIDAAPRILETVPDAAVAIIGGGPLGEQLSDRDRRSAMAAESVRRFESNFRLERMVGDIDRVYAEALSCPRA